MASTVKNGIACLRKGNRHRCDALPTELWSHTLGALGYRGGHGFESRWSPDFFQASSFQLLKLKIYCDDHTSLSSHTAVQIWIISYMFHSVRKAREAYLIERGQTLEPEIRKMKLSTFLLYQLSMFRSFVLFIAVHYYFSSCNVFP